MFFTRKTERLHTPKVITHVTNYNIFQCASFPSQIVQKHTTDSYTDVVVVQTVLPVCTSSAAACSHSRTWHKIGFCALSKLWIQMMSLYNSYCYTQKEHVLPSLSTASLFSFDLLLLSWIKPNQDHSTAPWAWLWLWLDSLCHYLHI